MNFNLSRTSLDFKPPVIERIKGMHYIYRYDIQEEEVSSIEEEGKTEKRYSFVEVSLAGYPNRRQVVKALLKQLITLEGEFNILNDYNEVVNLEKNYKETEEYKVYMQYITLRHTIKNKVKEDFNQYNF